MCDTFVLLPFITSEPVVQTCVWEYIIGNPYSLRSKNIREEPEIIFVELYIIKTKLHVTITDCMARHRNYRKPETVGWNYLGCISPCSPSTSL